MKVPGSVVFVAFGLLLALAPLSAADPAPGVDDALRLAQCNPGDLDCLTAAQAAGLSGAAPSSAPAVKVHKPNALDRFNSFVKGAASAVSHAAGAAASAVSHAASAFGAAVVSFAAGLAAAVAAGARAFARFLLQFRPAKMPLSTYASLAAGGTAVASTAVQGGLWLLLRKLTPWLSLVPGFSRIAKDELLENERRAGIYEMIKQNPGIRMGELAHGLDLPWGTAIHHLRKLRADHLVTIKPAGRHKCYFLNGSGLSESEMHAASLVHGATLQGVAAFIGQNPSASLKEVAAGVGISSPLAAFHVSKLERAGLVLKVRDGRSVRLQLATPPSAAAPSVPPAAPVGVVA